MDNTINETEEWENISNENVIENTSEENSSLEENTTDDNIENNTIENTSNDIVENIVNDVQNETTANTVADESNVTIETIHEDLAFIGSFLIFFIIQVDVHNPLYYLIITQINIILYDFTMTEK